MSFDVISRSSVRDLASALYSDSRFCDQLASVLLREAQLHEENVNDTPPWIDFVTSGAQRTGHPTPPVSQSYMIDPPATSQTGTQAAPQTDRWDIGRVPNPNLGRTPPNYTHLSNNRLAYRSILHIQPRARSKLASLSAKTSCLELVLSLSNLRPEKWSSSRTVTAGSYQKAEKI